MLKFLQILFDYFKTFCFVIKILIIDFYHNFIYYFKDLFYKINGIYFNLRFIWATFKTVDKFYYY